MPSSVGSGAADLFEPFRLGAVRLKNRVAMAPMTRSRAGADGVPGALASAYYAQRAGAGLIIAEGAQISADAQGYPRTPGIYTPPQVEGWRNVTDAVHREGGAIFLQLWHVGRASHPENRAPGSRAIAPSAIAAPGRIFTSTGLHPFPVPVEMSRQDIDEVLAHYAHAADCAMKAGFDGVELHGANGYLVDQFLHSSSNHRIDAYGGTVTNRCRFLGEVVDVLANAVGADRLGVRLSPFGAFNGVQDEDDETLFGTAIGLLESRNLAYLHVINPEASGDRTVSAVRTDIPKFARRHYRGTLIVAGGYDAERAARVLREGDADMVAFGRPFISNPDLVQRLRNAKPLNEPDRATFYTEGSAGYTDYPVLSVGC